MQEAEAQPAEVTLEQGSSSSSSYTGALGSQAERRRGLGEDRGSCGKARSAASVWTAGVSELLRRRRFRRRDLVVTDLCARGSADPSL